MPAESLMATVRSVAREKARMMPVTRIGTLAQADRTRRDSRIGAFGMVAGFGGIVLLLASIGLYAMMSIAVGQRRREIGVRVALGARASQLVMMFFRGGLRVALTGLAIGLPVSLAGLGILVRGTDISWSHLPRSALIVTLAVLGAGALASWLPARRAAAVDPMVALRSE